jgi:xanthine dehydrogenase molybdenum-binding subunit
MESEIDEIAAAINIDPLEFRLKNKLEVGDIIPLNNVAVSSSGLEETMLKGAAEIGWHKRNLKPGSTIGRFRRGIGMASYCHYSPLLKGTERSIGNAVLMANIDGSFQLLLGTADIGQGLRTIMAQIASEALGGTLDEIDVTLADTAVTPWATTTAASRSTMETGGAVKRAAEDMKQSLIGFASGIMGIPKEELGTRDSRVYMISNPSQNMSFSEVLRHPDVFLKGDHNLVTKATYSVPQFIPPYGSQFAEVEVDTETGEVRVIKMVAASDVGRAVHPKSVEGQLEGGIHMGIGFALSEELKIDAATGVSINPNFLDYKIYRSGDMPEIKVIIVEPIDPQSVYGVKGVGEMTVIATAPAVRNAIFNATGAKVFRLPLTSENVLVALKEREG